MTLNFTGKLALIGRNIRLGKNVVSGGVDGGLEHAQLGVGVGHVVVL